MSRIPNRSGPLRPPGPRGKPGERETKQEPKQEPRNGRQAAYGHGAGSSFAARFGRVILQHGVAAIPSALYHYQGTLGLSAQQVWFISYVLSHKWDEDLPYPSLKKMAKVTSLSLSQLQRIKNSLCQADLLKVYPRFNDKLGQATNSYDFSGLFDRLETLILGDAPAANAIRAEGEPPSMAELGEVDPSFVARYGRVITRRGVAAVPRAVFTHQQALGLSAQQVWFITYIFSFQWDTALPYPSIRKMASVTGYSSVQLHTIKAELVLAGYLRLVRRATTDGGQDTNAYDFSGLLDGIRQMLQPEKKGSQKEDAGRQQAEEPQAVTTLFRRRGRRGGGQNAALDEAPTGGSINLPGGASVQLSGGGSTELSGRGSSKFADRGRTEFIEGDSKKLTGGGREQLVEGESKHLAAPVKRTSVYRASPAYQGGSARDLHEEEESKTESSQKKDDSNQHSRKGIFQAGNGSDHTPFSPYLAAIITDFSNELNDADHVLSNVTQALRIWQMSGLKEQDFAELLFETRTRTRSYQGKQGLGGINNKMAYYFKVLRDLERQAREG